MSGIFLGLGSNLGNRENNLYCAIHEIKNNRLITIDIISSFYKTSPIGKKKQPDFLNAVIKIETKLTPDGLLFFIKTIENRMGRIRFFKWGPRNIDIDIIFYNDLRINKKGLIIPHPEIKNRLFVMEPLLEIAPDILYPGTNIKIAEIVNNYGTSKIYSG